MASNVSGVYLHVIDDVVSKVRDEFINSGTGESVLSELQALWEMKMLQCGVISGTAERSTIPKSGAPITPVHDLNMPYEGPVEEYETPTAEMLFPPTPAQTPLPGTAEQSFNIPTAPSDYSPLNDIRNGVDGQSGRQSPYMHPFSPWMNQRQVGVDVNIAYVESNDEVNRGAPHQPMTQDFLKMSAGKRKRDDQASQVNSSGFMPQQDGSGDVMIEFFLPKENLNKNPSAKETEISGSAFDKEARGIPMLPQQDGVNDDYNDMFHRQGAGSEGYSTPAEHVEYQAGTPAIGTPRPAKTEGVDDDEPPLNEDDDDDDDLDDLDEGEEEPNTQHLVLAQFDKVTRTKSRWKCTLKDGIMHINNRDILFNKASGEFEF